ncbi:MAG: DUF1624 domain-containing protein [Candidatus Lokiarchaeota archaeon]|nr:DUF1624 domain-containing protein [Candidatus Lokiarchaeota archaeon]
MIRFKGIDIFRGLCIFYMTFGHMLHWWLSKTDFWLYEFLWNIGAPIGGGGFLLVSGLSASLSYRKQIAKAQNSNEYDIKRARNEYLLRAVEIFIISTIWNTFGYLYLGLPGIWLWFVLQTISVSLLMAWPLFKTTKSFRLLICFCFWIGNEIILGLLSPHSGEENVLGVFYFILYNSPEQNVILGYFPFLLLGTILGDILFEASNIKDPTAQSIFLKAKFIKTNGFSGLVLILLGIFLNYPAFMNKETFSSHMFIVGIELIIISFLIYLKDLKNYRFRKKFTFFEYYSYYSFTIFLLHHLLFFLFQPQFNALEIWLYIVPIMSLWTILFRFIYKKVGKYASVKFIFNKIAVNLAKKMETISLGNLRKLKSIKKIEFV